MTTLFIILIVIAAIVLSLIVLVQNPKGGGLAGSIAGFSNQFMGVKQTNDVLERGTWIFAGIIAILCITSTFFIDGGKQVQDNLENIGTGGMPLNNTKSNNATSMPGTQQSQTPDSGRK